MISSLRDTIQAKLFLGYIRRLTKAPKKHATNHQAVIPAGIGLLYTYDPVNQEKAEAVLAMVKKLQAAGKQVQVLCYVPDNKATRTNMPFDTVTKKDINLLGKSTNEAFNRFLKSSFAYLYHLDVASDTTLDYIVAKCIAHCKIGNYRPGREVLFQLMFKGLEQPAGEGAFGSLIGKMFNYTQLLKVS